MSIGLRWIVSGLGATALVGSVLTDASASNGSPPLHRFIGHAAVKHYTVNGSLYVSDVLKINKNLNVRQNTYMRGKAEIYKGLLVRSGGIKSDSLNVTGPIQGASANIAGNLQAGAISGNSLTVSSATVNGALTASGKVSGAGVDAGAGPISTTGNLTAGPANLSSLNVTGQLTAGGGLQVNGLTVTGNVNFTGANVTGLNTGQNLEGATVHNFTVDTGLTVGSIASGGAPLTLRGNGQTAQLAVNNAGAITTPNLAVTNLSVSGTLSITGTSSFTTSVLQAPNGTNNAPGPLTLQGNGITLSGTTTLSSGSDLVLASNTTNSSASHVIAAGDPDVAGVVGVSVSSGTQSGTQLSQTINFVKPYTTRPIVVLSPASDPEPLSNSSPKFWVTVNQSGTNGQYSSFTINYVPNSTITNGYTATFNYHVIAGT